MPMHSQKQLSYLPSYLMIWRADPSKSTNFSNILKNLCIILNDMALSLRSLTYLTCKIISKQQVCALR